TSWAGQLFTALFGESTALAGPEPGCKTDSNLLMGENVLIYLVTEVSALGRAGPNFPGGEGPLVVQYRCFRNTDPPHLVEIWNESFTGRGAARLRHSSALERHVFCKPYFDPRALHIAEDGGRPVGFAHAAFGPNQRETALSRGAGVI